MTIGSFESSYNRRPVQKIEMRWSKFKDNFQQQLVQDDTTLTSNMEASHPNLESSDFDENHRKKPKPICGGDFRRDEYCSHYRNVHW